jgi:two-component system OmpR family sensor kinase
VLIVPAAGQLSEAVVHGVEHAPLLAMVVETTTVAGAVAEAGEPVLIADDLEDATANSVQLAVLKAGFTSAIAVPLTAQNRLFGMLTVYGGSDRRSLDEDELELASILGATAAMGYANALAFRKLETSKTGLESTVEQRTDELKTTIEEVRHLNRELQRGDAIKNELISRMTAQLDTPVQALVTAVGALDRLRGAPVEKTTRLIEVVKRQADVLAGIVETAGQASLLVTGTEGVDRQETSLPVLLRRAIAPLRDLAAQLEVEIKVLSPGDLETVSCDGESMATALRAIIKNALEHNHPGGEVRVEVHRVRRGGDRLIEFKIGDTGDGIAEEDLEKAFEAFWQGAAGAQGESRGIGLGLVVAKQVVTRHGGQISIARRSTGGTEVSIILPQ